MKARKNRDKQREDEKAREKVKMKRRIKKIEIRLGVPRLLVNHGRLEKTKLRYPRVARNLSPQSYNATISAHSDNFVVLVEQLLIC